MYVKICGWGQAARAVRVRAVAAAVAVVEKVGRRWNGTRVQAYGVTTTTAKIGNNLPATGSGAVTVAMAPFSPATRYTRMNNRNVVAGTAALNGIMC